jgi:hypothetical protein
MHYERAAQFRGFDSGDGGARIIGEDRQSGGRMALYLEGKTPLSANDLSLKEATA